MKYELWFKQANYIPVQLGAQKSNYEVNQEILTEPPDSSAKSGYHLVVRNDPPKQEVSSPESLKLPNTLQEIYNRRFLPGTSHLGKVVSQLLTSECVTSSQYQSLHRRLASLAEAYDNIRQALLQIPLVELRLADEAVAEQTGTAK